MAIAVFGAGCFWGVEYIFQRLPGVTEVLSGYAGGRTEAPTYRQVCGGETGHAEVVQISYDPARVSFEDLAKVFFECHDPTTRDRQGPDVGDQYRSVIYCQDDEQRTVATRLIAHLNARRVWPAPIVTELAGAARFWPAEAYHQRYYERKQGRPYCHTRRPLPWDGA